LSSCDPGLVLFPHVYGFSGIVSVVVEFDVDRGSIFSAAVTPDDQPASIRSQGIAHQIVLKQLDKISPSKGSVVILFTVDSPEGAQGAQPLVSGCSRLFQISNATRSPLCGQTQLVESHGG
jgi:hypothetical protein